MVQFSREYQGEPPHGGYVTWAEPDEDECCEACGDVEDPALASRHGFRACVCARCDSCNERLDGEQYEYGKERYCKMCWDAMSGVGAGVRP